MKKMLIILLCIMVMACNQELEKEMPITEPAVSELPIKRTERQLESITFKNVLKLKTKQYRVTPLDLSVDYVGDQWADEQDAYIRFIYLGNIDRDEHFVPNDDFPPHAAKIFLSIELKRTPYKYTKADVNAFETDGEYDELVILIDRKSMRIYDGIGGEKGNLLRYKYVNYKGSVMKNLTKPDIIFDFKNF